MVIVQGVMRDCGVLLAVLVAGLLAGACATPGAAPSGLPVGEPRKTILPQDQDQELLAEAGGWRMLKRFDNKHTVCMAIKPAAGTSWPETAEKDFYPKFAEAKSADITALSGDGGFYMFIVDNTQIPYFGFYGRYPYRLPSIAEVDGATVYDTNNLDTVMSWEGREVKFKAFTQPSGDSSGVVDETAGTVDFTGVTAAYERMMECHQE